MDQAPMHAPMILATTVQPAADPMLALAVFACGACASALLTALARNYALRRELLDRPGPRRNHVVPTPRGGGIGPVMAMLLGGGALLAVADPQSRPVLATFLVGLAFIAGIGWLDDHHPLPAWLRLVVHLAAALAISIAQIGVPHGTLEWVVIGSSTIVIAGLVNAWNFMDGIDGIAASQAALVALVLLAGSALAGHWLAGAWWNLGWLLLAAMLGFLPFNVPRARIFLGDVGSGALGFAVASLLLRAVAAGRLPWPLALVTVSAFLIDAGMTLLSRILSGKPWWRPHREHLYQWLVRSGYTHLQVTRWYAMWTLVAGGIAIAAARCGPTVSALVGIGALSCATLLWIWSRNRLWAIARHRR
jgi:UDP-N-acetylmuramyl pentapeptide phosphotransferase/UDP-N-acetylglucosamine-1-phosphate transferase